MVRNKRRVLDGLSWPLKRTQEKETNLSGRKEGGEEADWHGFVIESFLNNVSSFQSGVTCCASLCRCNPVESEDVCRWTFPALYGFLVLTLSSGGAGNCLTLGSLGGERNPDYSVCHFPRCKYSHHGGLQATFVMSRMADLGRDS